MYVINKNVMKVMDYLYSEDVEYVGINTFRDMMADSTVYLVFDELEAIGVLKRISYQKSKVYKVIQGDGYRALMTLRTLMGIDLKPTGWTIDETI